MQTSANGRKIIEAFEGLYLRPYYDSVGVLTSRLRMGYGHTNLGGVPPAVVPGLVWTQEQADQVLSADLKSVEADVTAIMVGIPLTQDQFDALVSFHFNTGDLRKSSIPVKMRMGNLEGAIYTLTLYNHAGGNVLPGLTRRRQCEAALMRNDVATAFKIAGING